MRTRRALAWIALVNVIGLMVMYLSLGWFGPPLEVTEGPTIESDFCRCSHTTAYITLQNRPLAPLLTQGWKLSDRHGVYTLPNRWLAPLYSHFGSILCEGDYALDTVIERTYTERVELPLCSYFFFFCSRLMGGVLSKPNRACSSVSG